MYLLTLAKAHPLIAAVIFFAVGALMTRECIQDGTRYARFLDGQKVVGTVVELRGKKSIPAKHDMTASWQDEHGNTYSGDVDLFKHEYESLEEGSEIDLLLASDDHAQAIVADHLKDNSPITIAGVKATPLVFFGLAIAILGICFPMIAPHLSV